MKTQNPIKRILINILICAISIAVSLFILEFVVRIFFPQSHYAIMSAPWGFQHIPNAKISYYGEMSERDYPVPIQYNSKSLRDYEYAYEKPKGVFRILILGDSWAEDMGSFLENLHAKRLEKKLNDAGAAEKFEVINAGHYAYDDAQELMYFIFEGRRYSPDIVILFYSGDKALPKYATIENEKLKLHIQNLTPMQEAQRKVVSFLRSHSDLANLILDRMKGLTCLNALFIKLKLKEDNCYAVFPKGHPALELVTDKGLAEKVAFKENNGFFEEVDKQIFLTLKKEVEKYNGKFIFLSIGKILSPSQADFLKKNGFYVLEMDIDFKAMGEEKIRDKKLGVYDKKLDSHRFGYKRNEVVAQQIMDYLEKNKLIPQK